MIIHFVTCGTSILSETRLLEPLSIQAATDSASGRAALEDMKAPLAQNDAVPWQSWADELVERLATADTREAERWSAELTSLFGADLVNGPVSGDDTVVLMASDTSDGFAAAIVVGAVLAARLPQLGVLTCYRDPGELGTPTSRLLVVSQPGRDPMGGRIDVGLESIVDTMLAVLRPAGNGGRSCVTHLAGGFKATIPFLLLVLSAFRCAVHKNMTARVAFEKSDVQQVLLAPIARMRASELRAIATAMAKGGPVQAEVGAEFDQVYQIDGGLRPIGRAMAKFASALPTGDLHD